MLTHINSHPPKTNKQISYSFIFFHTTKTFKLNFSKWSPNFNTIMTLATALKIPFDFLKIIDIDNDYVELELEEYEERRLSVVERFYDELSSAMYCHTKKNDYYEKLDKIINILKKYEDDDEAHHITNRFSKIYPHCSHDDL